MSYRILNYTKEKALKLGVIVKPSVVKGKKIDVFNKKGEKLASIGAIGYGDYPSFKLSHGKEYADNRRKLYKQRHESDRHLRGSAGWFADQLLW